MDGVLHLVSNVWKLKHHSGLIRGRGIIDNAPGTTIRTRHRHATLWQPKYRGEGYTVGDDEKACLLGSGNGG